MSACGKLLSFALECVDACRERSSSSEAHSRLLAAGQCMDDRAVRRTSGGVAVSPFGHCNRVQHLAMEHVVGMQQDLWARAQVPNSPGMQHHRLHCCRPSGGRWVPHYLLPGRATCNASCGLPTERLGELVGLQCQLQWWNGDSLSRYSKTELKRWTRLHGYNERDSGVRNCSLRTIGELRRFSLDRVAALHQILPWRTSDSCSKLDDVAARRW
jgi:hypothetical protein